MKVAVTARGTTPQSTVDENFGRAYWFLLFETESEEWLALSNAENRVRREGAGTGAAKMLADMGIKELITGQCGPRATRFLRAAGINVYCGHGLSLEEAVSRWKARRLQTIESARCEGNPYCLLACNRPDSPGYGERIQLGIRY